MPITLSLPYPDSRLSPNARGHWGAKARVAKTAKASAFYLAKSAGACAQPDGVIPLTITFHPPDRRGRDMDNAIASLKPHLDGLALAMGVNDNRFRLTFVWAAAAPPGRVVVVIGSAL